MFKRNLFNSLFSTHTATLMELMIKEDEKGQMQNDIQLCTLISVVMSVCFDFMKERMIS
jgi:hypothetical protein